MFCFENVSLCKPSPDQLNGGKSVDGRETKILSGINLDIPAHQITAVIGPSGAGKSSLLRLMNRLDDPTEGTVYYESRPLNSYPVLSLRRRVGMVFQIPVMFTGTVAENIRYAADHFDPASETATPKTNPQARVREPAEYLEMVGLSPDLAAKNAALLSVGQQQRVALARTLANRPDVLLLDEPTAALDPATAAAILDLIGTLRSQLGLTVVMVTHILDHAKTHSDFTAFIRQGRLLESGPTSRFFSTPQTVEAQNFIGGNGGLP